MKTNKVAIIGAGVNGLYLAWKLAQAGNNVVVFEKRNKIGKEACSGLFSQKILEFIPESEKLVENKIKSVLINFPKKRLKVSFKNDFLVIDHSKLDNLTAELAQKSGAKIILNQEHLKKEDLLADFNRVIGCDGANSMVRGWLNSSKQQFFLGIQGFEKKESNLDYVEVWPTDNGFIWKIPKGKQTEWGIMEDPKKAKLFLDNFIEKNNLSLTDIRASLIPKKFFIPKNKSITICGDAAGLIKPWSGGGVIWGLIAADLILKNFPCFLSYQKKAKRFFLLKIIFSKTMVRLVYFFGFNLPWLIPKNNSIKDDFLF